DHRGSPTRGRLLPHRPAGPPGRAAGCRALLGAGTGPRGLGRRHGLPRAALAAGRAARGVG
ncbi:MAG: hypothetical protein AVDCRST_MAG52-3363, partial [uncultured Blastococcus sp.]